MPEESYLFGCPMLKQPNNSSLTKESFPLKKTIKSILFSSFSKWSHEENWLKPCKIVIKMQNWAFDSYRGWCQDYLKKVRNLKATCLILSLVTTSTFSWFPKWPDARLHWHYSTNNNSSYLGYSPKSNFSWRRCCYPRLLSLSLIILQRQSHFLINIHLYI